MNDSLNMIVVLLCMYLDQGKKFGEIVEHNGVKFKLVISEEEVPAEKGVAVFRLSPGAALFDIETALKEKENETKE